MGFSRAFDFDWILDRLHHRDGVSAARDLAARIGNDPCDLIRAGRLIEPHGLAGFTERAEIADEGRGVADIYDFLKLVAHGIGQLASVGVERWAPFLRNDGVGEWQWRVCHIGAADVERPGNRMRIGDHKCIRPQVGNFAPDAAQL